MNLAITVLIYTGTILHVSTLPAHHKKLCQNVLAVNCLDQYMTSGDEEICASNGIRYLNKCLFVQAKCKDPSIKEEIDQEKCEPTGDSNNAQISNNNSERRTPLPANGNRPEMKPTPPTEENAFCNNETPCPETLNPLCASDYSFYLNICEFKKAKCKNEELYLLESLDYC